MVTNASCPAGTQMTGGGMVDSTSTGIVVVNSPDVNESWTVAALIIEGSGDTGSDLIASVVCYSPVPATLTCPAPPPVPAGQPGVRGNARPWPSFARPSLGRPEVGSNATAAPRSRWSWGSRRSSGGLAAGTGNPNGLRGVRIRWTARAVHRSNMCAGPDVNGAHPFCGRAGSCTECRAQLALARCARLRERNCRQPGTAGASPTAPAPARGGRRLGRATFLNRLQARAPRRVRDRCC